MSLHTRTASSSSNTTGAPLPPPQQQQQQQQQPQQLQQPDRFQVVRDLVNCATDLFAPVWSPITTSAVKTWPIDDARWPALLTILLRECGLTPDSPNRAVPEARMLALLERLTACVYFTHSWKLHDCSKLSSSSKADPIPAEQLLDKCPQLPHSYIVDAAAISVSNAFSRIPDNKSNTVLKCVVALLCCIEVREGDSAVPAIKHLVSCALSLAGNEQSFDASRAALTHVTSRYRNALELDGSKRRHIETYLDALCDEAIKVLEQNDTGSVDSDRLARVCAVVLQCLATAFTKPGKAFRNSPRIGEVGGRVFLVLLRTVLSSNSPVFEGTFAVFRAVVSHCRGLGAVPRNVPVFIFSALFPLARSKSAPLAHRQRALDALAEIVSDPRIVVDFFLNYDCRENQKNVFNTLLTEAAELGAADGNNNNNSSVVVPPPIRAAANKVLLAIASAVQQALEQFMVVDVGADEITTADTSRAGSMSEQQQQQQQAGAGGASEATITSPPPQDLVQQQQQHNDPNNSNLSFTRSNTASNLRAGAADALVDPAVKRKHTAREAAARFNEKKFDEAFTLMGAKVVVAPDAHNRDTDEPAAGAAAAVKHGEGDASPSQPQQSATAQPSSLPFDADTIGRFLYRENTHINKMTLGEYLSKKAPLNRAVLKRFIHEHDFARMTVDEALRMFLGSFKLLGEAQVVDYTVEHFAAHYIEQNPDPQQNGGVPTAGAAFVLAFSICMLNTDAHSPNVAEKMTLDVFVMRVRSLEDGVDLPDSLLKGIYERIVASEITLRLGPNDPKQDATAPSASASRGNNNNAGTAASSNNNLLLEGLTRAVMLPFELTGITKFVETRRQEREFSLETKKVITAALNELKFAARVSAQQQQQQNGGSHPNLQGLDGDDDSSNNKLSPNSYIHGPTDLRHVLSVVDAMADTLLHAFLPVITRGATYTSSSSSSQKQVPTTPASITEPDFAAALRGATVILRCFVLSNREQHQTAVETKFRAALPATSTELIDLAASANSNGSSNVSTLVAVRRLKIIRAIFDTARADIATSSICGLWPDVFRFVGVVAEAGLFASLSCQSGTGNDVNDANANRRQLRNPIEAAAKKQQRGNSPASMSPIAANTSATVSGAAAANGGSNSNSNSAGTSPSVANNNTSFASALGVSPVLRFPFQLGGGNNNSNSNNNNAATTAKREAAKTALQQLVFFDDVAEDVFGEDAIFELANQQKGHYHSDSDNDDDDCDNNSNALQPAPSSSVDARNRISVHVLHAQIDSCITVCVQEAALLFSGTGKIHKPAADGDNNNQSSEKPLRPVFIVALLPILSDLLARFSAEATRIVWESVWAQAAELFVTAGTQRAAPQLVHCAVEQLSTTVTSFLRRAELANFSFQRNCMQPFISVMFRNNDPSARIAVVRSLRNVARRCGRQLASGWEVVLNGVGHAALFSDDVVAEAWHVAQELALMRNAGAGNITSRGGARSDGIGNGNDEGKPDDSSSSSAIAVNIARLRVLCVSAFVTCRVPSIALAAVFFTDSFVRNGTASPPTSASTDNNKSNSSLDGGWITGVLESGSSARMTPAVWAKVHAAVGAFLSQVLSYLVEPSVRCAALCSATGLLLWSAPRTTAATTTDGNREREREQNHHHHHHDYVSEWLALASNGFAIPLLTARAISAGDAEIGTPSLRIAVVAASTAVAMMTSSTDAAAKILNAIVHFLHVYFVTSTEIYDQHDTRWAVFLLWVVSRVAQVSVSGSSSASSAAAAVVAEWSVATVKSTLAVRDEFGAAAAMFRLAEHLAATSLATSTGTTVSAFTAAVHRAVTTLLSDAQVAGTETCEALLSATEKNSSSDNKAAGENDNDDDDDGETKDMKDTTVVLQEQHQQEQQQDPSPTTAVLDEMSFTGVETRERIRLVIAAVICGGAIVANGNALLTNDGSSSIVDVLFSVFDSWCVRAKRSRNHVEVAVTAEVAKVFLSVSSSATTRNSSSSSSRVVTIFRWICGVLTSHQSDKRSIVAVTPLAAWIVHQKHQQQQQNAAAMNDEDSKEVLRLCIQLIEFLPSITLAMMYASSASSSVMPVLHPFGELLVSSTTSAMREQQNQDECVVAQCLAKSVCEVVAKSILC